MFFTTLFDTKLIEKNISNKINKNLTKRIKNDSRHFKLTTVTPK